MPELTDAEIEAAIEESLAWQREIEEEQACTKLTVAGQSYPRIRYGTDFPDGRPRCRDCGVKQGQIHVFPCLVERCPRCIKGQAAGCPCARLH